MYYQYSPFYQVHIISLKHDKPVPPLKKALATLLTPTGCLLFFLLVIHISIFKDLPVFSAYLSLPPLSIATWILHPSLQTVPSKATSDLYASIYWPFLALCA